MKLALIMVVLLPYLVPLLLVPLSLYLLSSVFRYRSKNLPPGSTGWPILGENMEFVLSGPRNFIKHRMAKYSPEVFRTSLLGEKVVVFCLAQGNKFLFTNGTKLVKPWWPQSVQKPMLFPGLVIDGNVQAQLRRFQHDILKPEALRHYIPLMDVMARKQMDSEWVPKSEVKVLPLTKKYTFELACRLFLGVVDPEIMKGLWEPFTLVANGIFTMPIDLPGTAYHGALKGGRLVRERLMRIINHRRKEMTENKETEGRDILSKMLLMKDEHGEFLSEMVISDNIIGLVFASFESTSSAIAAVLYYLAELPHVYAQVFKEQMEIAKSKGPDELLTWEDIERMKYSWNVARESFRLMPPGQGSFREAATEFTFAGFTIPKGWKIFWTVYSSNMNPDYFPEPEKFNPSRFEGSGPPPYTFVPFGGGPRMCIGKEYARVEVLVYMHNVVRRFRFYKAIPDEKIVFGVSAHPAHGLPLHLHPHDQK